jgi:hypothetical protein
MGGPTFNTTVSGNGNPGVRGTSNSGVGRGVRGTSTNGVGVEGTSTDGLGVVGKTGGAVAVSGENTSDLGTGVQGNATNGIGVLGDSLQGIGVAGNSSSGPGVDGTSGSGVGVQGLSSAGTGVVGRTQLGPIGVEGRNSVFGIGVEGRSSIYTGPLPAPSTGVQGVGDEVGVIGITEGGIGVLAQSGFGDGIDATGSRAGVRGRAGSFIPSTRTGVGVYGTSTVVGGLNDGVGVRGEHNGGGIGVDGQSVSFAGVRGLSTTGAGVLGIGNPGGFFAGGVTVINGDLRVINGNKPFTIDHPLDPQNKYLVHVSIESSERKNIYDGVARLDNDGAAWVELPEWFEALNEDFRYQLTAIGGSAPNLHVAKEISENRFKIAGGEEGMKICWQVTGCRGDPWAAANPFEVEEDKRVEDRGRYLDPSVYGAPEEQKVTMAALAEEQREPELSGVDLGRLEEEHQRRTRPMEDLRRGMEELRRTERQDVAPPEST